MDHSSTFISHGFTINYHTHISLKLFGICSIHKAQAQITARLFLCSQDGNEVASQLYSFWTLGFSLKLAWLLVETSSLGYRIVTYPSSHSQPTDARWYPQFLVMWPQHEPVSTSFLKQGLILLHNSSSVAGPSKRTTQT